MVRKARGLIKSLHSPEHEAFCALLLAARHKAGVTQQIAAKRLKRPQSFIAKVEGGERRLDVVEFLSVAKAINADPVKILRELIKAQS